MSPTLFIPFAVDEGSGDLEDMAWLWAGRVGQDPRGKQIPLPVTYSRLTSVLSERDPAEAIYVLAHGGGDPNYVYNNRGGMNVPTNGINSNGLAARLAQSGLSPAQRSVKLFICNVNGTMRPFAERMKGLLSSRCLDVTVSFYIGSVSVPIANGVATFHKFTTATVQTEGLGFVIEHINGGPILGSRASGARIDL